MKKKDFGQINLYFSGIEMFSFFYNVPFSPLYKCEFESRYFDVVE